jgi:hypothetical protein
MATPSCPPLQRDWSSGGATWCLHSHLQDEGSFLVISSCGECPVDQVATRLWESSLSFCDFSSLLLSPNLIWSTSCLCSLQMDHGWLCYCYSACSLW